MNDMEIVKLGDREFFLFLDIFVHWSGSKITAAAPYYGDDIDWAEHGVDLDEVVLTLGSDQVQRRTSASPGSALSIFPVPRVF